MLMEFLMMWIVQYHRQLLLIVTVLIVGIGMVVLYHTKEVVNNIDI